jgi:hypothetical protein
MYSSPAASSAVVYMSMTNTHNSSKFSHSVCKCCVSVVEVLRKCNFALAAAVAGVVGVETDDHTSYS